MLESQSNEAPATGSVTNMLLSLGMGVGRLDGTLEAFPVGTGVGLPLGGVTVGSDVTDGDGDGICVGKRLGSVLGANVGAFDGVIDGIRDGPLLAPKKDRQISKECPKARYLEAAKALGKEAMSGISRGQ